MLSWLHYVLVATLIPLSLLLALELDAGMINIFRMSYHLLDELLYVKLVGV